MSSAGSNTSNHRRILLFLVVLAGIAAFIVLDEWEIVNGFSRFLSAVSHDKLKYASKVMPTNVVNTIEKKTVVPTDSKGSDRAPNETKKQPPSAATQLRKPPQPPAPNKTPIKRIVLIGERHSGTSYVTRMLTKCYPNLRITDFFVRYKHWFQPTPEFVINVTATFLHKQTDDEMEELEISTYWPALAARKDTKNAFKDTIVIVMVRNAYDWLEAMREGPHHWPNHFALFRFPDGPRKDIHGNGRIHEYGVRQFEWKSFVNASMSLSRNIGDPQHICQNGFTYGTISPCLPSKELYPESVREDYAPNMSAAPDYLNYNADKPNYELNPDDGMPFANPLAFRAAKIQNFLDIPNHWNLGGFMVVKHEKVNEKGSHFVLKAVSDIVGVNASCDADPPKHQESYQIPEGYERWITRHTDWETERTVGYEPRLDEDVTINGTDLTQMAATPPPSVERGATADDSMAHRTSTKPHAFDRIILLGERHSGTTYTTRILESCFSDSIEVSDFFARYKHWFQPTPEFVVNTTREYLTTDMTEEEGVDMFEIHNQWPSIAALEDPKASAFKNTLLIVMFRNPYDWIEALRTGPHHWTNHFSLYRFPRAPVPDAAGNPWYGSNFSSWTDFIKTNMTYAVADDDIQETRLCQNGFLSGTVTPCHNSKDLYPEEVKKDYPNGVNEAPDILPFNAGKTIYELDSDGKPYSDPLAFRAAKIKNFLDIPNNWDLGAFMALQYEDIDAIGPAFLIEQVGKIVGQSPQCEPDPPRNQPSKQLDREWQEWITENADWETERKIGYEPRPVIQRIAVIGERHSGTSYTTRKLKECFPKLQGGVSVEGVSDFFARFKHWFQASPEFMLNATTFALSKPVIPGTEGIDMLKIRNQWPKLMSRNNTKAAFKDTLVVAMFRSPYDWLEAMREVAYHWPNHVNLVRRRRGSYVARSLHWKQFVSANMTLRGENVSDIPPICQNAYPFGSVSPCLCTKDMYPDVVKSDYASNLNDAPNELPFVLHKPIYELNQNGQPFANPLELRTAKIKNFLDVPNQWDVGGFIKVQHEELNEKGPLFLINMVAKLVGMKPECKPDPAKRQEAKTLARDWADWITMNADWETEMEIGYQPRAIINSRHGDH